jgi:hypothetical protein
MVRGADIKSWTILRPAFFMQNFLPARVQTLFCRPSGKTVAVKYLTEPEAMDLKVWGPHTKDSQLWQRDVEYAIDLDALKQYPVRLTPLSEVLECETLGF